MNLPRPNVLVSILADHFRELDALWDSREAQVFDALLNLEDLADLEARAFAQRAGLRVGQGHAADLAFAALEGDDASSATAAVFALLALGHAELGPDLVQRMESADPAVCNGIRIGLRHHPVEPLEAALRAVAASESDVARACASDVLAFHRRAPVDGVEALCAGEDPLVRRLAVEAIGRWGGAWDASRLEAALADEERDVARAALVTSARTGLAETLDRCRAAAEHGSPDALEFLGLLDGANAVPTLVAAAEDAARAPGALAGLGASGAAAAIPPLLDALGDVSKIHAAGLAFIRITGQDEIRPDAAVDPPEGLDEIEEALWDPHPEVDPGKARAWWSEHGGRFGDGPRWQYGLDVSEGPSSPHFDALTLEARHGIYLAARWQAPGEVPDLELERAAYLQRGAAPAS